MATLDLLRNYLQKRASIDPVLVVPEAQLETIGVDSLMLLDLMFELEDRLGVSVPDDLPRPTTVGELVTAFESLQAAKLPVSL